MSLSIRFCGAAGTVTGSCYWLKTDHHAFLIDCGMFQGSKTVKTLNYSQFPFGPNQIDFVLLTHAHIDHAGLLPKLVRHGFVGPIYTTRGTRDLLSYMLPDSAYIQEMEVRRLNQRNRQRGKASVKPIYDKADVVQTIRQIRALDYEEWVQLPVGKARFWNAGHILGAASIELMVNDPASHTDKPVHMVFSGDIGPDNKLFHPDPNAPSNLDYLICESTYGGRKRMDATPPTRQKILATEINQTLRAGGSVIIPAFAVERTQELLLDILSLIKTKQIPHIPIFLDSPLAIKVTSVFSDHADELEDIPAGTSPFDYPGFHFTESVDESKAIARFKGGAIIIAASGMCDAGRIRHHLKNHLWRSNDTLLLIGFQAEGTLGRMLQDGKKRIKIQGEEIYVNARICYLDVYSGHGDHNDLKEWIEARLPVRKAIFLTHGENTARTELAKALTAEPHNDCKIICPQLDEEYDLLAIADHPKALKSSKRLAPDAMRQPDWHNELAQFTLDLRHALEAAKTDKERQTILANMAGQLKRPR